MSMCVLVLFLCYIIHQQTYCVPRSPFLRRITIALMHLTDGVKNGEYKGRIR